MILLDTNIFIYLANGKLHVDELKNNDIAFASISKIEALGITQITAAEQGYLKELFNECEQIDLAETIIQQAIKLRQRSKITLGDSIVAACAMVNGFTLWTANVVDFKNIEEIHTHNPLKE